MSEKKVRVSWHEKHFKHLILIPSLILFIFLTVYPLVNSMYLSFHQYAYIEGEFHYIGFGNYARLLNDELFVTSIINTLRFVILATFSETLLGLGLALLFNFKFKGKKLMLPIVILPMMVPTMVVCAIWAIIYDYEFGIINSIIEAIGFGRVRWLSDPRFAMESLVLVDIWQWTPFAFLILLAGLQSIPEDLYEAAKVDGSTKFQVFKNITLPLLKPHVLLVILLRTIDTFRIFDKVYALTRGGPGHVTETITYFIYREGFYYFNLGYSTAASVIMLLLVLLVSAIYIKRILGGGSFG